MHRSVTLESSTSFFVSLRWDDGVLHLAYNDIGDGPSMGEGRDIHDPERLLTWLCADRFTGVRADDRLLSYLEHHGIAAIPRPPGAGPGAPSEGIGLFLRFEDERLFTWRLGWGDDDQCLEIEHWRQLLLQLVEDRCEGSGAWDRVLSLLVRAGIETTRAWRGYG